MTIHEATAHLDRLQQERLAVQQEIHELEDPFEQDGLDMAHLEAIFYDNKIAHFEDFINEHR